MKRQKRGKGLITRIFSFIIAFLLVFSMGDWRELLSYGGVADITNFKVDEVTVFKVYNRNRNLVERRILIMGTNIQDAEVGIMTSTKYEQLTNRTVNSPGILQYELTDDQLGDSLIIEGISIPLNEADMPTLSNVTRQVLRGDTTDRGTITLQGANLDKIATDPDIYGKYEHLGVETNLDNPLTATSSEYAENNLTGPLGLQNVVFEKEKVDEPVDFPIGDDLVNITIIYNYQEQFRLVENIGNVDDLKMFPNRGEKGDKVYFTGKVLDEYDVFFLKDINGTDPYTSENKGKNKTFLPDSGDTPDEDVLTVEVPDIPVGEYYVVLTNAVADDKDPMEEVNQTHIVRLDNSDLSSPEEKFYVIDGSSKASIISVQPNSGPDAGQEITISGEFLGTLNVPEFVAVGLEDIDTANLSTDIDRDKLTIDYDYVSGEYNGLPVDKVIRNISITIGGKVKFELDGFNFTKDLDTLKVITPQITDAEDDPVKDVVAEIETVFQISGGGNIVIKERAELKDGYTYIPSKLTPTVIEILPKKIQVVGSGGNFETQEDILIGIYGENFAIHKYVDGNGIEKVMYPYIEIGEVVLNKSFDGFPSYDPNADVRIFNSSGEELDGTEGNEIGTKILVTIPSGTIITNVGKNSVKITNPVRNSGNMGLSYVLNNAVEFVVPDGNKIPVINEVNPNIVTVEGGEEVKITGSNFQDGVMVFIDGSEVQNIERTQDGKEITFISPPGREGETQILVMNEEGGMDIYPFIYVKTYTNPQINDFSPKRGNTGILVVVDGDNFLKPDPTADENNILKFVGARIFLEGMDINTYNMDTTTKKIILENYTAPDETDFDKVGKVLRVSEGKLKLEEYYHSIVLHDETEDVFYIIDVESKGDPYITNGVDEKYDIKVDGSDLRAEREGGGIFTLSVKNDGTGDYIELTGGVTTKNLRIKTPFKIEDNIITGDRVKVIGKNKIYFTVPILQTDGYYDLSVVNPDTKRDTKKDEAGFYYFRQPQSNPRIDKIEPNQGSNMGGYTISIFGNEFMDNGISKTKVNINGVEIAEDDVVINTDGTQITVKVPPYQGDIGADLDTDRITVPVVVLNPDGGSDSKENGFTYVIPTSNPEITKIVPGSGNAAGGNIVEITGFDFRFFEPFDDKDRDQAWDIDEVYEDINNDGKWNNEDQIGTIDDWSQPVDLEHEIYDKYFSSPILPKVYFGDKRAKIVEFSTGYLKVILPPAQAGAVEVYVINNDSGLSNKVNFTYNSSDPTITSVIPNEGRKQGRDKVEIKGSNFQRSYIKVYNYDSNGNVIEENKSTVLVNFGKITNRHIPRTEENSGLINNGRTTVNLEGNFKIEYDGVNDVLRPFIEIDGVIYQIPGGIEGYNDTERYIPVNMLKDPQGSSYDGYELIRVWVDDNRLYVERGYSPEVEYIGTNHLIVNTPSYYTIGTVPLTIINPDGGKAQTIFTYKNPDSSPKITNITKEGREPVEKDGARVVEITYKGGNIVSIYGEDFREGAIIQISDILTINEADIAYQLPNRLTFTMPAVSEDIVGVLHRVVVKNQDGGIASSDESQPMPIYIQFIKGETFPSISKITPGKGPSTGGTKVTIKGEDFRDIMNNNKITVYFGSIQVPSKDVTVIDYKTIEVYTPPHAPGTVEVKVENPDGELSSPVGTFTYISSPKITSVVDSVDNKKIYTISVEGGEKIRIKGSGFSSGARVIFNPVLKEIEDEESDTGKLVYIGEQIYVLEEGIGASQVEYKDSETLDVITPKGTLGSLSLILINPDDGGSNIYKGLEYGLPDISPPRNVVATLMYDKYIKVDWDLVEDAFDYEVYVIIDDGGAEYIGSTDSTSIVYEEGLETRTEYRFLVKSVGEYGESLKYGESNTVETGRDVEEIEDEDGEIAEETSTERIGDKVELTLGTSDYDDEDIQLDLTKTKFAGVKEVIVSMPSSVIASYDARDISITGGGFRLKLNPKIFYNSTIRENREDKSLGVKLRIGLNSQDSKGVKMKSPQGSLSKPLILEGYLFDGKEYENIEYLKGSFEIVLDFDSQKAKMRRYRRVELCRYDEYEGSWTSISSMNHEYVINVRTLSDRLGKYSVVGKRE